ncbi:MAG: type IV pili methyl-accepting chemotaxis transducer N-terminal domain-containing protein [Deltaproteobacteria bacterium]|nr:type IV pili methyl-accepting chemotaxis transducer N-terminal domain-containing protein [Deltaproteobacteria bacterium]MBW2418285.1 type IV pili methyl-accepting chemotaxis transducer N-terminal domain-containing protein [Deltaproteobacteria bacterium]
MRPTPALASFITTLFLAHAAAADLLPFEISTAEALTGQVRWLAEKLSKQNLLYQLHLGDVHKSDLVATAAKLDRSLEMLAEGSPTFGIPAPWTPEIRAQIRRLDEVWGPLRAIATASPYEYLRRSREFMTPESRLGDPLSIRYFDVLRSDLVAEADKLGALYDHECRRSGFPLCDAARISGATETMLERAAKEAIMVFAGIDVEENKKALKVTVAAFQRQRAENEASNFFKAATAPEEGKSGEVTAQLLADVRKDWAEMSAEFDDLLAGKTADFDLPLVLKRQRRIIGSVERLRMVMGRFFDRKYGA